MGRLVLMGSGETAPTMVRLHRRLLGSAGEGRAVVVDTPFGFQVNADDLVAKTLKYFADSVGHEVEIASWRRRDLPTAERERALAQLHGAAWAFAGPGSPSFTLRQWTDTPMPDALRDVAVRGGTLCLGSAAAVVTGAHALPVYEIYKAGVEPHWLDGIDVLGALTGITAAVVPHYDNNEGGHYDTRFCYLGERRLALLESQLPDDAGILGVDEHTAVVFDLDARTAEVVGAGAMTVRRRGVSTRFEEGATLSLDRLAALVRGDEADAVDAVVTSPVTSESSEPDGDAHTPPSLRLIADETVTRFDTASQERDVDGCLAAVLELEQAIEDWANDAQEGDDAYARRTLRALIVRLGEAARSGVQDPRDAVGPFVEIALRIRARAREANDFATSDLVRDELAASGVEVKDTSDGTTWQLP